MNVRDLLIQLHQTEPGMPMRLPLFLRFDVHGKQVKHAIDAFWAELTLLVNEKNPCYIEITDMDQLADIHLLDYFDPLYDVLQNLLLLNVSHLHFNFSDIEDHAISSINKLFHCLKQTYQIYVAKILKHSRKYGEQLTGLDLGPVITANFPVGLTVDYDFSDIARSCTGLSRLHILLAYARVYEGHDDLENASLQYCQAIELYPDCSAVYMHRAGYHARLQNYQLALNDYREAIRAENRTHNNHDVIARARYHSAQILMSTDKIGNIEKSAGILSQVDSRASTYSKCMSLLNEAMAKMLKYAETRVPVNKAVTIDRIMESLSIFSKVISLSKGSFRQANLMRGKLLLAYYSLPELHRLTGFKNAKEVLTEANRDFESFLERHPSSQTAKQYIAKCEKLLDEIRGVTPARGGIFERGRVEQASSAPVKLKAPKFGL